MTLTEYKTLSTHDKIALIRSCMVVHTSLDELFTCDSCNITLQIMEDN